MLSSFVSYLIPSFIAAIIAIYADLFLLRGWVYANLTLQNISILSLRRYLILIFLAALFISFSHWLKIGMLWEKDLFLYFFASLSGLFLATLLARFINIKPS